MRLPRPRWLSLTVACVGLAAGCDSAAVEPSPISLTIATGGRGGVFYPLGVELSRLYTTGVPGVVARIESGGSSQNVKA
ncbi:MAG: hypothetical protein ABR606_13035, partial [Vicinamibacterales bacterium]